MRKLPLNSSTLDQATSRHQHRAGQGQPRTKYRFSFLLGLVFCYLCTGLLAHATTYYLSPYGNDANSGSSTSASWLSPNHSLNCGDVIIAAASTQYSATNFYTDKWGTVNCPSANAVAWLQCATFDACKIYTSNNEGMWVDKSFWGVSGWEVTTSSSDTYGICFTAQPRYSSPVTIHHIIFANDIANGCSQGGFIVSNRGRLGVDYVAILGSIAYNAAQGSPTCASGISIYQPVQSDSSSGTHIYVAGNFAYGNLNPNGCGGGGPTDGEGIIFDTLDGSQGGIPAYLAQVVAYNNIVVNNGGKGIQIGYNNVGSSHSTVWLTQNTSWGNMTDAHQSWYGCGEISIYKVSNARINNNLVSTKSATGCTGHAIYALAVSTSDGSDSVLNNFAYGYNGNNTFLYASGSFSYGTTNRLGTNPSFTRAFAPSAPQCGGTANVPACMSSVISGFTPTSGSPATGFGYQRPSSSSVHDSLFPHWLCTARVPAGLVTMGCS